MTDRTPTSGNHLPVPGGSSKDLSSLLKELAALRVQLAQRELDLVTARSELDAFKIRYYAEVGPLQAQLGELEVRVIELLAQRRPSDPSLRKEASEARERAREWTRDATMAFGHDRQAPPQPSQDLKSLFREVARTVHPDLGDDPTEAEVRQHLMSEANAAYARGDVGALRAILEKWKHKLARAPETETEIKAISRTIERVRERLRQIENELLQLRSSSIYKLKLSVERGEETGQDLFVGIRESLQSQIEGARERLAALETA